MPVSRIFQVLTFVMGAWHRLQSKAYRPFLSGYMSSYNGRAHVGGGEGRGIGDIFTNNILVCILCVINSKSIFELDL